MSRGLGDVYKRQHPDSWQYSAFDQRIIVACATGILNSQFDRFRNGPKVYTLGAISKQMYIKWDCRIYELRIPVKKVRKAAGFSGVRANAEHIPGNRSTALQLPHPKIRLR